MDETWLVRAADAAWDHYYQCWLQEGDDIENNPCAWPNPRDDEWNDEWGERPAADMLRGVAACYTRENYEGDHDPMVVAAWIETVDLQWFRDHIDYYLNRMEAKEHPYGFVDIQA